MHLIKLLKLLKVSVKQNWEDRPQNRNFQSKPLTKKHIIYKIILGKKTSTIRSGEPKFSKHTKTKEKYPAKGKKETKGWKNMATNLIKEYETIGAVRERERESASL